MVKEYEIIKIKIEDLKVDGDNPNVVSKKEREAMRKSMEKFGYLSPIIIDQNNIVADGEHRVEIYKDMGRTEIQAIKIKCSVADRKTIRQVLNKLRGRHDKKLDVEEYKKILEEIGNLNDVKDLLPNQKDEINDILNKIDEAEKTDDFDPEQEYNKIKTPTTKQGETYQLGDHRLVCGDNRDQESYIKLMGVDKADFIFTDPPFNINYRPFGFRGSQDAYSAGKYKSKKVFSDNLTEEEYLDFLKKGLEKLYKFTKEKAAIVMWNGDKFLHTAIRALKETNWQINQLGVWVKNSLVFSPGCVFHKILEYYALAFKDGKKPKINKRFAKSQTNMMDLDFSSFMRHLEAWYAHRDNTQEYEHPTQKPISLVLPSLYALTEEGDIVMDVFGGSGSTLVACEKIKRKCYIMELDPKFCDVIIKRWERFTGFKAKKLS